MPLTEANASQKRHLPRWRLVLILAVLPVIQVLARLLSLLQTTYIPLPVMHREQTAGQGLADEECTCQLVGPQIVGTAVLGFWGPLKGRPSEKRWRSAMLYRPLRRGMNLPTGANNAPCVVPSGPRAATPGLGRVS